MTKNNTPIVESFEEVTELAEIEPQEIAPAPSSADYICTMPVTTMDDALALFDALSDAEGLDDHIGEVFHIHDYVIQPVTLTDKATGEQRNANRIVLMCDEGNFATCSTGVETAMRNLVVALHKFPAPWNPGIAMKAVKEQGTNGFKFTSLVRAR